MTEGDDLYAELGVTEDATAQDIARAYERVPPSDAATDAYEVLGDATGRRAYDDTRRSRADAVSAASTSEHRAAGGTADVELTLTFDQAALGTTATVRIDTQTACAACGGSGTTAEPAVCTACGGAGSRIRQSGGITIRHECRSCDGTGSPPPEVCVDCDGSGITTFGRDVTLRVPPGVTDGARLRFRAPAPEGHRERYAVVRVGAHPYFGRDGSHLTVRVPVTIAEASLGAVVTLPTLGGAVAMRIPPGTPHGRTFRVRGQGIPDPRGPGDLLVTVEVVIPAELTDAQRHALEAFAAATPSPRRHFETSSTDDIDDDIGHNTS